jgi:hypothetical protein
MIVAACAGESHSENTFRDGIDLLVIHIELQLFLVLLRLAPAGVPGIGYRDGIVLQVGDVDRAQVDAAPWALANLTKLGSHFDDGAIGSIDERYCVVICIGAPKDVPCRIEGGALIIAGARKWSGSAFPSEFCRC